MGGGQVHAMPCSARSTVTPVSSHAPARWKGHQFKPNKPYTCWHFFFRAVVQAQRVHSTPSRTCFCANECSCGSWCAHGRELSTSQRRARGLASATVDVTKWCECEWSPVQHVERIVPTCAQAATLTAAQVWPCTRHASRAINRPRHWPSGVTAVSTRACALRCLWVHGCRSYFFMRAHVRVLLCLCVFYKTYV